MRRLTRHLDIALFAVLLALFLYESLVLLQAELRFTADAERDLFYILGLTRLGEVPEDGIRMAALGLDLGPLYFLLVAPFNAIWPSPQALHTFNVVVCAGGLVAAWLWLRGAVGRSAALLCLLLYTQSGAHTAFVDTAWHVGATPGVIFAFLGAAGWWARTGRRLPLGLATVALCVLCQLHALGSTYIPCALLLLLLLRAKLDRRALVVLGACATIALTPLLIYMASHLGDTAVGAARHEGGFEWRPAEFWLGLTSLVQPRYLLSPSTTGWVIALLAATGVAGTAWRLRRGERPWVPLWLIAQTALGAAVVSLVLPYENVGRYYMPVIIPLFLVGAYGARDVDALLRHFGRSSLGRALTWCAMVAGLATVPPRPQVDVWSTLGDLGARLETGEEEPDFLTLEEQELAVEYLVVDRGLTWPRMRSRVHGVFFGTLSGIRYLEAIYRDRRAAVAPDDSHWLILPEGVPAPFLDDRVVETVTLRARTRPLALIRYRPAYDPGALTAAGAPCPWPFPFLWTESSESLLKGHGFPLGRGPDVNRCMRGGVLERLTRDARTLAVILT